VTGTYLGQHTHAKVLNVHERLAAYPPVKCGRLVNRAFGAPHNQLQERHDASDFGATTAHRLAADTLATAGSVDCIAHHHPASCTLVIGASM
jgi:hypothetical protein